MNSGINLRTLLLASLTALAPAVAAAPLYHITKVIAVGSPENWDYLAVDASTHRVFLAHGDHVTAIDGTTGKVIGQIGTFAGGTHGIAFAPQSGRGYTDNGDAGLAEVFDLASLKPLDSLPALDDADGISFDPVSQHVFVVDGGSGKITVIDAAANQTIATIDVGGDLEFSGPDGHGKLYVNGAERSELVRIDIATNKVDGRWPLPGCKSPSGLAVDAPNQRVFSSCRNGVMDEMNGATGGFVATLPIGQGSDAAAIDPVRHRVFSSNGRDGTITVIDEANPDQPKVIGTVKTQLSGRTMAVDPINGTLYVAAAKQLPQTGQAGPPPGGPPAGGPPAGGPPPDGMRRPMAVPGSLKVLVLKPTS